MKPRQRVRKSLVFLSSSCLVSLLYLPVNTLVVLIEFTGYPWTLWANNFLVTSQVVNEYQANALPLHSPEMDRIREAVKAADATIVLGFAERDGASLYIAQVTILPDGRIANHRRKMKVGLPADLSSPQHTYPQSPPGDALRKDYLRRRQCAVPLQRRPDALRQIGISQLLGAHAAVAKDALLLSVSADLRRRVASCLRSWNRRLAVYSQWRGV